MPMTASLLLLGLGVVILSLAFTRRSAGPDAETSPPTQSPGLFPFAFVGGGLLYVFAIDAVGYLPATLVGAPFAFAAFGARGIVRMILAGLAAATVIYLIFFVGLGLYDPPGRLFSWRDLWGG